MGLLFQTVPRYPNRACSHPTLTAPDWKEEAERTSSASFSKASEYSRQHTVRTGDLTRARRYNLRPQWRNWNKRELFQADRCVWECASLDIGQDWECSVSSQIDL